MAICASSFLFIFCKRYLILDTRLRIALALLLLKILRRFFASHFCGLIYRFIFWVEGITDSHDGTPGMTRLVGGNKAAAAVVDGGMSRGGTLLRRRRLSGRTVPRRGGVTSWTAKALHSLGAEGPNDRWTAREGTGGRKTGAAGIDKNV